MGKYFHLLVDAGYAFKTEAKTTNPDGSVWQSRSAEEPHVVKRSMEDYSDTIQLAMSNFIVSFVFYFCIALIALILCLLNLYFISKLLDCFYRDKGVTKYSGHHGPHGSELDREIAMNEEEVKKREADVTEGGESRPDPHGYVHKNPLFDDPISLFYHAQDKLEKVLGEGLEDGDRKYSFAAWFPWFINSLVLLTGAGIMRLIAFAYLPSVIAGFLTLYLLSGGWNVPTINAIMGIASFLIAFLVPVLYFVFWLLVLRLHPIKWLYTPERVRVIRHVLGAFYADYQEKYAWFHILVIVRKFLVGATIGLFWQVPWVLIIVVMLVYIAYIVMLLILRPYNFSKWGHGWSFFPPRCHDYRIRTRWSFWAEVCSLAAIPVVLLIEFIVLLAGGNSGIACLLMIWIHILVIIIFYILEIPPFLYYLYRLCRAGCGCVMREEEHEEEENPAITPNPFFVTGAGDTWDNPHFNHHPDDDASNTDGDSDDDQPPPVYKKKKASIPSLFHKAAEAPETQILTPRTQKEFDAYHKTHSGKKKSVTMAVDPQTGSMKRASLFDPDSVKAIYGQLPACEGIEMDEKGKEKEKSPRGSATTSARRRPQSWRAPSPVGDNDIGAKDIKDSDL